MNQACVSLEEVFAAAGARAASLVPETSGYLTLAVADATSRLPYLHDDRAVLLTIDGSVMVPRKAALTAPADAARGLRDVLRRLLAVATGSMPGLASAAKVRPEEHDVEHVVSDVEAALIPVNRAAAKRALARLARETLRAKEMGKLRKKPPVVAPPPARAAESVVVAPPPPVQPPPARAADPVVVAPPPPPARAADPVVVADPVVAADPVVVAPPPPVQPPPATVVTRSPTPPPAAVVVPRRPFEVPPPPLVLAPPALFTPTPASIEVVVSPAENVAVALADSHWDEPDATVFDPDAMAVLEAHDETATIAATLVAERELPEDQHWDDDEDEDLLTRPLPLARLESPSQANATPTCIAGAAEVATIVAEAAALNAPAPYVPSPTLASVRASAEGDAPLLVFAERTAASAERTTASAERTATSADPPAAAERTAASADPPAAATKAPLPGSPVPPSVIPPQPPIPAPAASRRSATPAPLEPVRLETPTAGAAQSVLFSEPKGPTGTRADELLETFRAQDQSDAVHLAAKGLRAFTGVDATPPPRSNASRGALRSAPPLSRRTSLSSELEEWSTPPPRAQARARSRWPLAVFAIGVLALFAAWLYRPNLTQAVFGLRDLILPKRAPAAAPEPAADPPSVEPLAPARSREARTGDGAQRRRD